MPHEDVMVRLAACPGSAPPPTLCVVGTYHCADIAEISAVILSLLCGGMVDGTLLLAAAR